MVQVPKEETFEDDDHNDDWWVRRTNRFGLVGKIKMLSTKSSRAKVLERPSPSSVHRRGCGLFNGKFLRLIIGLDELEVVNTAIASYDGVLKRAHKCLQTTLCLSEKLEGLDEQERNNEAIAFKVATGTSAYVPRQVWLFR